MNYRHVYHAGNFADIFKHLVMVLGADYLQQKDKGLLFLDAFAGCGLYDLGGVQAGKTREFADGASRFLETPVSNPDLVRLQQILAPYFSRSSYPGSPLLMAELMRTQDKLIANELHPEDVKELQLTLGRFSNTRIDHRDAYECIRASIPPETRRGLVLVDPPYERKDEFERLARQMREWAQRWPTGCYMIWYPVKAGLPVDEFLEYVAELGLKRSWVAEFLIAPRDRMEGLNGCGMVVINTPYQLPEKIAALADEFGSMLKGRIEASYLTEDT